MKKFLYIATIIATVATATTSCKNEVDDLFDKSAADRTQEAQDEYTNALTANGGKWVLEYFTNSDEPGYIYIFTFDKNGSVKISGKNKWIENKFKSETSAWEVISDNGPVLTLNTYNTIFHLFANPNNVIDPDASSDETDETGYGHYGDYEFMLMEADENVVRLKGKKWGVTHYLRKLDADTDDEAYLAQIDQMKANILSAKFGKQILTDATGERFVLKGGASGVFTAYPEAGDEITQISSRNFIVTSTGIRFMVPFEIQRAAVGAEPLVVEEFVYDETDGKLVEVAENPAVITGPAFSELFTDNGYTWRIDNTKITGKPLTLYNDVASELKSSLGETFRFFQFTYDKTAGKASLFMQSQLRTKTYKGNIYFTATTPDENTVKFEFDGTYDKGANYYYNNIEAVKQFIALLESTTWKIESASRLVPSTMTLTSSASADDQIVVNVQ